MAENNIYTSLEEAAIEIRARWEDKELEQKIHEYLHSDIPELLKKEPSLALFKHIMTPNDENRRVVEMSKVTGLTVTGLEYTGDKFFAFNLDKYIFGVLFFKMGLRSEGNMQIHKKKIIDMPKAESKLFSEINTTWGQSLSDFHHEILSLIFPEFNERIVDLTDWIDRNGKKASAYYEKVFALFIRNAILVENYQFEGEEVIHAKGVSDESSFTNNVILPAFNKVYEHIGVKPLIVQLAPEDYATDPTWWHYRPELRPIIEEHMAKRKNNPKLENTL